MGKKLTPAELDESVNVVVIARKVGKGPRDWVLDVIPSTNLPPYAVKGILDAAADFVDTWTFVDLLDEN